MTTLAITGASGFVGRHFLAECLSQSGCNVRLLTRNVHAFTGCAMDNVVACKGDLLAPGTLGEFLVPNCTVVHLAYLHGTVGANIEAASNLAEAASRAQVKRVVQCSTAVVVGFGARGVITEETPPAPRGEYQETKYRIEQTLRASLRPHVELAILRPTEIIGPAGQGLQTMIARLRKGSTLRNLLLRWILGSRRFNYVSVHNVVAALMLLASTPIVQHGKLYQVSDDDDPDNNYLSLERLICSRLGSRNVPGNAFAVPRPLLSLLFRALPSVAPADRIYSHEKIDRLGYRKVSTLESAIDELIASPADCARS